MVTEGETWGGLNQELVMNTHTTVYKMDSQQDPLHGSGASTQHSTITGAEEPSEKK